MTEIERKFLVTSHAFKKEAFKRTAIVQGFLNSDKERTVRIRVMGDEGFITVKGPTNTYGLTRFEWEKEIPKVEAEALLNLCEPGIIEKERFEVEFEEHIFEVDVFYGANEGLIIAELELKHENQAFKMPPWIGAEVTGIIKYYNSQLCKTPYKTW